MRGIIVTSEYSGTKNSLEMNGIGINPVKLREYLLYWDKIDYPSNNIIYTELSPDEKYLENIGVLKRTNTIFNGTFSINPEIFIKSQMNAFEENSKSNDEIWSIAQPTKNIILPINESVNTKNIQVELYDCIPIPSANVSLEDILNFKEHRYDELQEFRNLLDETYEKIITSGDIDFTKNRCIENLQRKIIEINKVMNESRIKRMLGSVKIEIDYKEMITKTIEGSVVGGIIGFPTTGAILGLASSAIKISSEMSLKPKDLPKNLKDYAYLYYAQRELI